MKHTSQQSSAGTGADDVELCGVCAANDDGVACCSFSLSSSLVDVSLPGCSASACAPTLWLMARICLSHCYWLSDLSCWHFFMNYLLLFSRVVISCPAFSCHAIWSVIFTSCIFSASGKTMILLCCVWQGSVWGALEWPPHKIVPSSATTPKTCVKAKMD